MHRVLGRASQSWLAHIQGSLSGPGWLAVSLFLICLLIIILTYNFLLHQIPASQCDAGHWQQSGQLGLGVEHAAAGQAHFAGQSRGQRAMGAQQVRGQGVPDATGQRILSASKPKSGSAVDRGCDQGGHQVDRFDLGQLSVRGDQCECQRKRCANSAAACLCHRQSGHSTAAHMGKLTGDQIKWISC